MKILPHIWAEHILDLKKKRTKAVWKKIIWEKSLFGDIHGHDVVITRLMLSDLSAGNYLLHTENSVMI